MRGVVNTAILDVFLPDAIPESTFAFKSALVELRKCKSQLLFYAEFQRWLALVVVGVG